MQTNGGGGCHTGVRTGTPIAQMERNAPLSCSSTPVFQKMLQLKTPICYSTFMHKVKLRQMIPLA